MKRLRLLWQRIRSGQLARNTGWMLISHGGQVLLQALYFVLLARALDSDGLGAFSGTLALVMVLFPFADLGSGNVLIMHSARDRTRFPVYWGNALLTTLLVGGLLIGATVALGPLVLPDVPVLSVLVPLAVTELYLHRIVELCAHAFQALERLRATALLLLLVSVMRVGAALFLAFVAPVTSVEVWVLCYLVATALLALPTLLLSLRQLGFPRFAPRLALRTAQDGFFFALSISSNSVSADIDKTMLLRFSGADVAGIYTAAYRLISMAVTPLRAFLAATYTRFFRAGDQGVAGTLALASRYLRAIGVFGVVVSVGLVVVAPIIPVLLGESFRDSVAVLRWLALFPLIKVVQLLYADVLTGAGLQRLRGLSQGAIALGNVALNLWLIPRYGWQGAVVATLVSELVLTVMYVVWAYRHARRTPLASQSEPS